MLGEIPEGDARGAGARRVLRRDEDPIGELHGTPSGFAAPIALEPAL